MAANFSEKARKPKRFSLLRGKSGEEKEKKEFAKRRRRGLREAFEEFQAVQPEIVGLTVYGSLVKTRSPEEALHLRGSEEKAYHGPDSDVDAYVYVDVERAKERFNHANIIDYGQVRQGAPLGAFLKPEVLKVYKGPFQTAVKKQLQLQSDEQVKDVIVVPISREIIGVLLRAWREARQRWQEADVSPFLRGGGAKPNWVGPSHNLVGMFHLAIGRGLGEFRTYLIDQLQELGAEGEAMWLDLIVAVEMSEHDNEVKEDNMGQPARHYPRTLTDAMRVYGG